MENEYQLLSYLKRLIDLFGESPLDKLHHKES